MKIGLITLHRARNYGSVLQTYATQRILENMKFHVEIIDYYPERYHNWGLLKRLKTKSKKLKKNPVLLFICRCIIFPSYIKKIIVFDKFLKHYLNLSKLSYNTVDDLVKNPPIEDAYCTGSDQVWNSYWNEKIDLPLFLDFVKENKLCFSFAASFGKSYLEEWEKSMTKELLKKYKYVSVREDTGIKILENLGVNNAIQIIDPTLILNESDWKPLISNRYNNHKYILVYNLHRDKKLDEYAKKLSSKENLKVYYISYNWHDIYKFGKILWCPSVEEYLGLIKYAQVIITDSFHATAFSINFNKQFIVSYPDKASSRINSILNLTNLNNRVLKNINELDLIENKINFTYANKVLDNERAKAESFLNLIITKNK